MGRYVACGLSFWVLFLLGVVGCTTQTNSKKDVPTSKQNDTLIDGKSYSKEWRQRKDSATQLIKREGLYLGEHPMGEHAFYDTNGHVRVKKEYVHWDKRWVGYAYGVDPDLSALMSERFSFLNQARYYLEDGQEIPERSSGYWVQSTPDENTDSVWYVVHFQERGFDISFTKLHLVYPNESNKIRVIHQQGPTLKFKRHKENPLDGMGVVWMREKNQEATDSTYLMRVFRVLER